MTDEQAWLYAASWGSYITGDDPGACLYSFDATFTVQSEHHRADCIREMQNNCAYVLSNPDGYDTDEMEKISALIAKLHDAPCEEIR